jgi:Zn-finger nucleic acid-binding protein
MWLQRGALSALYQSGALEELGLLSRPRREEDRRTGLCPEGHGILTRAKVAWQDPYYVERCSKCGGLWLDSGELQRLIAQNLIDDIDELWQPAWRRQLQREQAAAALRGDLSDKLGPELVEKLESLAIDLASQPHANLALAFLREAIRAARPGRSSPDLNAAD